MRRHVLALGLVAAVVPLAAARAQNAGGGGDAPTATTTATQQAPTATATDTSTAEPPRPATGYGYSDHKPTGHLVVRSGARHPHHVVQAGPVATLPGFEMLPEGGSRLFVELTQQVRIDEHHARGKLVYVLHGARVSVRNNENPLVTVHFNTPVTRARLVPVGHDLHFIVDLRAAATPTWKANAGKEGSFVLTIDFPKGSYLPGAATK